MFRMNPAILDTIGNTPLVELRHIVPAGSARIVLKLESHNPTGSMKDRMARAMIEGAIASGALAPGPSPSSPPTRSASRNATT